MKKVYYFSHDYNAQNDEKILKLMSSLGWEGYGLYWGIVEKLYEADGYLKNDYNILAFGMRTHSDTIKSVIEDFDLFVIKDNKFYSKAVLDRLDKITEKSKKARESAYNRWNNANAMRTESDSYARKERKGKEIKRNIIIDSVVKTTPNKLEIDSSIIEKLKLKGFPTELVDLEIKKFMSYWTEPNQRGKQRWQGQKFFDVNRRIATWFSRIAERYNNNQPKNINLDNL